ncbi:MAG: DUF362 domain-containing protein [Clostridia bacterium]|nr:DUF362 domain-containing protein [Clostridia bacterium]
MSYKFNDKVYLKRVKEYDFELIKEALKTSFEVLNINLDDLKNRNVVIKPNLVMKTTPDKAATTHPIVLSALLSLLNDNQIKPIIAESPGGIYSEQTLNSIYRTCGIENVCKGYDCTLNFDVSFSSVEYRNGKKCKRFDVIKPIVDADVVIDLCKLKTHTLASMSAAVKNFFGVVPGIIKFEMHSTYSDHADFFSMICDLAALICETKNVISITDGIIGMEGEGPTGGNPKQIGALLVSKSPFSSDVVAANIIGLKTEDVGILEESASRDYMPSDIDEITVLGEEVSSCKVDSFEYPSTHGLKALRFFSTGLMGKFFKASPVITNRCKGCGKCKESCPKHTIIMENNKAKIISKNCIRCYCCQELCPFTAIDIKRNPIIKIINSIR